MTSLFGKPASLTRRGAIGSALAIATLRASGFAFADDGASEPPLGQWRHALAIMGTPKYPKDFKHFDYVNPEAPKGGVARLGAQGTFDNFNPAVDGIKGNLAAGIGLVHATLIARSLDEVGSNYGFLAEEMMIAPDRLSVGYRLNPKARFENGDPVTPEDVIFSFDMQKKLSPQMALYYHRVTSAEKTGEREVTFHLEDATSRELPLIVGELMVLPKAWFEGKDAKGSQRDIGQTSLEPPMGAGPYRLKSFSPGRSLVYERVKDHWAENLPAHIGTNNFGEIRFEYYKDPQILLEAFKGDQIDFRNENSAKNWATGYDFPAVKEGRVVREEIPDESRCVMQAFVFNTRLRKFQDPRVRRAFNYAFDFETLNTAILFGLYKRIGSYFEGTELASSGLPGSAELALLEPMRSELPPEVFTSEYKNPLGGSPEADRNNLREADRLLKEAGYEIKGNRRVDGKTGEALTIDFLAYDQNSERFVLPYKASLERLGVATQLRVVDPAQYENRVRAFDFDALAIDLWPESLSPGNEQRDFWGSAAADQQGSTNHIGIKNKAIDALIDKLIAAETRPALLAAVHALDRVLLWNNYVVPQWTTNVQRTVRWNRFARPQTLPIYGGAAFSTIWWYDAAKAAVTGAPKG
jgi:microcin C transport system substrate-binding protein